MIPRGKKNRRRKSVRPQGGAARSLLRAVPRPRLPRGRAAVVSAIVLAVSVYAAWQAAAAYARGSLLTATRVTVDGNSHWDAGVLLERAGVDVGRRLHEIGFRAGREALEALPGVEDASVRYVPGGLVRVSVREAGVVAMRRDARGWRGLTPAGEWMPLAERVTEDVPVLEGRGLSPAAQRRVAGWLEGVRARHPEVFAGFSQVSPRGESGEADVYWRDGRVRLRVDCRGAGDGSLGHLVELLRREQADWAAGTTVDLRIEGYAYVR